jgi:hypothetical protein
VLATLPALTCTVRDPYRSVGHRPEAAALADRRRGLLRLFPEQRAGPAVDQAQSIDSVGAHGLVLALARALWSTTALTMAFDGWTISR